MTTRPTQGQQPKEANDASRSDSERSLASYVDPSFVAEDEAFRTAPGPIWWDGKDSKEQAIGGAQSFFANNEEKPLGDGAGHAIGVGLSSLGFGSMHVGPTETVTVPPGSFAAQVGYPQMPTGGGPLAPPGLFSSNEANDDFAEFQAATRDLSGIPDFESRTSRDSSFYDSFWDEGLRDSVSSLVIPQQPQRAGPPIQAREYNSTGPLSQGSQGASQASGTGVIGGKIHSVGLCPPIRSTVSFEFGKQLGSGSYGQVFHAHDKDTKEAFALKRFRARSNYEAEGFPISSLREIKLLIAARDHPNVVALREIVVSANEGSKSVYLVLELVDRDLRGLLKQYGVGGLPLQLGKKLLQQLFSALGYLHGRCIIHRDLKPSNLLISATGQLKVADFGLSKEIRSMQTQAKDLVLRREHSNVVVTLWYRPPELLLGATEYGDHAAEIDMWGAGCIVMEVLTGAVLFDGRSDQEQRQRILDVTGFPSEEDWPGVSDLPLYQEWYENFELLTPPPGLGPRPRKPCHLEMRNHLLHLCAHHGADLKGAELALQLLQLSPCERLSAQRAIEDPWFEAEPATRRGEGEEAPRSVVQPREWIFSMKQVEARSPSVAAGIQVEVEKRLHAEVCLWIWQQGGHLPVRAMSTACIYYHRFYLVRSLDEVDAWVAAKACLFLACKAEETGIREVSAICSPRGPSQEAESVLQAEHSLLKALRFDCTVEPLHDQLLAVLDYWHRNAIGGCPVGLKVEAWHCLNRCLLTKLCLCCTPRGLALGALNAAIQVRKRDFREHHIVPPGVQDAMQQHAEECATVEVAEAQLPQDLARYMDSSNSMHFGAITKSRLGLGA